MNIQPSAASSSIAGTQQAAAKGGEADNQASEASRRLAVTEKPAGKTPEAPGIDAGEPTGDRGGDGREMYDRFDRSKEPEDEAAEESATEREPRNEPPSQPGDGHVDFQA